MWLYTLKIINRRAQGLRIQIPLSKCSYNLMGIFSVVQRLLLVFRDGSTYVYLCRAEFPFSLMPSCVLMYVWLASSAWLASSGLLTSSVWLARSVWLASSVWHLVRVTCCVSNQMCGGFPSVWFHVRILPDVYLLRRPRFPLSNTKSLH